MHESERDNDAYGTVCALAERTNYNTNEYRRIIEEYPLRNFRKKFLGNMYNAR